MLHYFLHFNQHIHTHPNSCILIHISLVLLPSSRCPSQNWETFVIVWLYSLAHHPVHFLGQQRNLLSHLSHLPSSIFFKPFKAWVAHSPSTRAIHQWLKVRKHTWGWGEDWWRDEDQETGEKKYWKNKGRGKKESGISKYEGPMGGEARTISL